MSSQLLNARWHLPHGILVCLAAAQRLESDTSPAKISALSFESDECAQLKQLTCGILEALRRLKARRMADRVPGTLPLVCVSAKLKDALQVQLEVAFRS